MFSGESEGNLSRREIVKKAIKFGNPERLPIYHWFDQKTKDKYGEKLGAFLQRCPPDLREVGYPPPSNWKPKEEGETEWGFFWPVPGKEGKRGRGIISPLTDWSMLKRYPFPNPRAEGRFETAAEELKKSEDIFNFCVIGNTFFEIMRFLRGTENILCDFHLNKDKVLELMDRILEYNLAVLEAWIKMKLSGLPVDGIYFLDDMGTQDKLIMNPSLWREIIKPGYKTLIEKAHKANLPTMLHSCGNITEIMPDLIEIGLDVINPIQPNAMNIDEIGRKFRGKICFLGGVDTQQLLCSATPEEIKEETNHVIERLGTPEGGYIGAPATSILDDCSLENIKALYETFKEYKQRRG